MEDDVDGLGARGLRDERQEAVPQRERIAGVQPAVGELVRAGEREVAEGKQLLDAGEMEEPVSTDVTRDVPEEKAEERTDARHGTAVGTLP